MKVIKYMNLKDFEFWSGAKDNVCLLTDDELERIESYIEDICPDGVGETELNDFMWFETEVIATILGYKDWEQLFQERNNKT